jgi:hypothetical protein
MYASTGDRFFRPHLKGAIVAAVSGKPIACTNEIGSREMNRIHQPIRSGAFTFVKARLRTHVHCYPSGTSFQAKLPCKCGAFFGKRGRTPGAANMRSDKAVQLAQARDTCGVPRADPNKPTSGTRPRLRRFDLEAFCRPYTASRTGVSTGLWRFLPTARP